MLVDTSVWVDHFRRGNTALSDRLTRDEIWCHPFVIGELACGNLSRRTDILRLLSFLPSAVTATHEEACSFVETNRLMGKGIGWIDAHLLASAALTRIPLWTVDRKLSSVARSLGLSPSY